MYPVVPYVDDDTINNNLHEDPGTWVRMLEIFILCFHIMDRKSILHYLHSGKTVQHCRRISQQLCNFEASLNYFFQLFCNLYPDVTTQKRYGPVWKTCWFAAKIKQKSFSSPTRPQGHKLQKAIRPIGWFNIRCLDLQVWPCGTIKLTLIPNNF